MRISRDMMWMEMAFAAARRSTCMRRNVGAIIVDVVHKVPVSIGYNGPASGEDHCTGKRCTPVGSGCTRALHAESNAVDRLPVYPFDYWPELVMYTTESPCPDCARKIIGASIVAVYYTHLYRVHEGVELVIDAGIKVFRMTPAGLLIDHRSGELIDA